MFLQRENELAQLTKNYENPNSSIDFIFGPKNSGKTTLSQEFTKEKNSIYFSNFEMIPTQFFTQMADVISNYFYQTTTVGLPFKSFQQVLEFFEKQDVKEKLVLVFDDFQNILKVDRNALIDLTLLWKKSLNLKIFKLL